MSDILIAIFGVLGFIMLIFCFWAMRRDKALSAFYKQIGVCGRWYAFFTVDFLFAGVMSLVACPVTLITWLAGNGDGGQVLSFLFSAVVGLLIGVPLYLGAYKKCPDPLKKRLLWDMIVMGFGAMFRVSLFVMMFIFNTWWEMNKPTAYVVDGRTVYAYPGSDDLYDDTGMHVGKANSDRTEAIMD